MKNLPHASPIRRAALHVNVWDNRAEGMATAMEEIILHAGYYDDNPRAREIVWIMLAQRFTLRRFLDEFNGAGVIPVSLIRWLS